MARPMAMNAKLPIRWALQFAGKLALGRAGYRLELRRSGELKLGLWRKSWRQAQAQRPRRFVLVPAFGDSLLSWLPVLIALRPILRRHFDEIVIVDFPGGGGFLSHERSFHSMDLLMCATFDVFDSLGPHTILGHSLGGWLAGFYAGQCGGGDRPGRGAGLGFRRPERVMLVDPFGGLGAEPAWFSGLAEDVVQLMESIRPDHQVELHLPKIASDICLLWGENDSLIPAANAHRWVAGLKKREGRSMGVLVRGAGHSPHLENPGATAAAIGWMLTGRAPNRLMRRNLLLLAE
jgi:pimeloyl-ACP methyl ester carboxylesterase